MTKNNGVKFIVISVIAAAVVISDRAGLNGHQHYSKRAESGRGVYQQHGRQAFAGHAIDR